MASRPRSDLVPPSLGLAAGGLLAGTAYFVWTPVAAVLSGCSAESTREGCLQVMAQRLPPAVTWFLLGVVLVVTLVIAFCLALVYAGRSLASSPGGMWGWAVALGLVGAAVFTYDGFVREAGSTPFAPLYESLGEADANPAGLQSRARLMGAMGLSVSVVVWLCMASFLYRLDELDLDALRLRRRALHLLFYLLAAGLVSGTIATGARLELRIDPGLAGLAREHAETVVTAASIGYGGLFSCILAAAFLPVSWMLQQASVDLHFRGRADDSPEDREKWLASEGLLVARPRQLVQSLLILAPLLSSPIAAGIAKLSAGMLSG